MPLKRNRATITKDKKGGFRYHVQARNGKVIDRAEEPFTRKATVLARIKKRHPDAEIVEDV